MNKQVVQDVTGGTYVSGNAGTWWITDSDGDPCWGPFETREDAEAALSEEISEEGRG